MGYDTLDAILAESVREITGKPVGPRSGQRQLSHDIHDKMAVRGRLLACAPVGSGKSLAALAAAYEVAAESGERTVISTESLSLMSQIIDKDAPMFAKACEQATGYLPTFAVLKGFSNYVCSLAAHNAALEVIASDGRSVEDLSTDRIRPGSDLEAKLDLNSLRRDTLEELKKGPGRKKRLLAKDMVQINDHVMERETAVPLVQWALTTATGDKGHYRGDTREGWGHVSVSPGDCPGADSCPFGRWCLPREARAGASEADVVVTNHSILAVQANTAAPVIFGNKTLGEFDHLIVDECHALPGVVRNGGGRDVGARRIRSLAKALGRTMTGAEKLVRAGETLADEVDLILKRETRGLAPGQTATFEPDDNPLGEVGPSIESWASECAKALPAPTLVMQAGLRLSVTRMKSKLESLADDVGAALRDDPTYAKWVESAYDGSGSLVRVSPVDVAGAIAGNLFKVPMRDESGKQVVGADGNPATRPISVTMMSGTVPPALSRDVGLGERIRDYDSPFDAAYGNSMLFIPRADTEDALAKIASRTGNRWKFDISKHCSWATDIITALVDANEGHALILSAKKSDGEHYAQTLRRLAPPGVRVFSQWDGRDVRQTVAMWREDPSSVLVGTRSLMTGTDAAGETCSLVVLDRIPRDAQNVVDDARVESLMQSQDLDKWSADRYVYGSDACLRLEQSVGRLIRSVSDAGMVAVLDPRLVPGTPISYPKVSGDMYLKALRRFGVRRSQLGTAVKFLRERAASRSVS